ncbi:hypothetical protein DFJ77DRAFT_437492 [Powellomyces hirtus]|nr:hypothetical protein DFJ77DRAFT_437492 [Powellomyces hirtus]
MGVHTTAEAYVLVEDKIEKWKKKANPSLFFLQEVSVQSLDDLKEQIPLLSGGHYSGVTKPSFAGANMWIVWDTNQIRGDPSKPLDVQDTQAKAGNEMKLKLPEIGSLAEPVPFWAICYHGPRQNNRDNTWFKQEEFPPNGKFITTIAQNFLRYMAELASKTEVGVLFGGDFNATLKHQKGGPIKFEQSNREDDIDFLGVIHPHGRRFHASSGGEPPSRSIVGRAISSSRFSSAPMDRTVTRITGAGKFHPMITSNHGYDVVDQLTAKTNRLTKGIVE